MSSRESYNVVFMTDSADCETCGTNYAEGYCIYRDGDLVVDKTPVATCFGGPGDASREDAYYDILRLEGIHVSEDYVSLGDDEEEE